MLPIPRHRTLKLIKNRVRLIQISQMGPQGRVDMNDRHGHGGHVGVPDLDREVVAGVDVAALLVCVCVCVCV